jgi:hypothetical protein
MRLPMIPTCANGWRLGCGRFRRASSDLFCSREDAKERKDANSSCWCVRSPRLIQFSIFELNGGYSHAEVLFAPLLLFRVFA